MIRTLDAGRFNIIANNPLVRPWLGGRDVLDLTDLVANPNNFAFLTDDSNGGYFYHKLDAGLYAVHTLSIPGQSHEMARARGASLRAMFTESDAVEIVTLVPDGNRAADLWSLRAAFRELYRREKAFDLMGEMVGVSYRSLGYRDWVTKDAENLSDGRAFHAMIHELTPDDHGDDPVHDSWCGATMECCAQMNAEKGIALYNRYAMHAGYEPIRVLTAKPLLIDIRTAILQIGADGIQVLHVRDQGPKGSVEDDIGAPGCPSPLLPQAQA